MFRADFIALRCHPLKISQRRNLEWKQSWCQFCYLYLFEWILEPRTYEWTNPVSNDLLQRVSNNLFTNFSIFFRFLGRAEPSVGIGDHCAGCNEPILDKFLLNVSDRRWHATCVRCCECLVQLTDKCFSRDAKLYCKKDFFR